MLVLATKRILNKGQLVIEHSIDNGVYCEIMGVDIDKPVVEKIEEEMNQIVKEGYLFTKVNVSRYDTIKYFKKNNRLDKEALKY